MKKSLIIFVRLILQSVGIAIYRYRGARLEMSDALLHLKKQDFNPLVVIDVGVAHGTPELYKCFPKAKHLLVEPVKEFTPYIEKIMTPYDYELAQVAAGSKKGSMTIYVKPSAEWSSMYKEKSNSGIQEVPRMVQVLTLDELCEERALKGPYLLKLDVEGAEMDVMDGACKIMEMTDVVILEVTFIARLVNAPEFTDIIKYMDNLGFVTYDIYDLITRGEDEFLFQANITFVKRDSLFRKY